ncbi:MAG: histidine kinase dimerization/phospho-acceptor domain-containing protein [Verrucomicrobiota bacterium]|nr:histidine kinase dimerization/phospho-acceptor domain-containing protein [Verrucomicrobiota bacterium]
MTSVVFLEKTGDLSKALLIIASKVAQSGIQYVPQTFEDTLVYRIHGKAESFLPRVIPIAQESGSTIPATAVILENVTELQVMLDLKSNFVGTVSHELKTPLTSLRLLLHLLDETELTQRQKEMVTIARLRANGY